MGALTWKRTKTLMPISLQAPLISGKATAFWRTAQILGVVVTLILIWGFIAQPDFTLPVFWNVLIPVLPASFLIAPALWRGTCPLATLNMLPNSRMGRRALPKRAIPTVNAFGIVLLVVLVPARRFLFNEHGIALAVVVIAVAVAALVLGTVFDAKAGFCNAICPVLSVEKLYGQHPLIELGNPHCALCLLCTPKGCMDLAPTKAALQALGPAQKSAAWLMTPFGIFAAAFPGFVVGYFTTTNGPLSAAPSIYLNVALWAGGSYLVVAVLVWLLKIRAAVVLPVLAAASIMLYYWFAAPTVAETLAIAPVGTLAIQSAAFVLIGAWLWRAMRGVQPLSNETPRPDGEGLAPNLNPARLR
jgi:hypothetical protein